MIPSFPEFKNLELSDQEEIEKITSKYQPYSDFNFESVWSWDIDEVAQISELNGNLVLIYKNHLTDEIKCSYLGSYSINDTLEKLFEFVDKSNMLDPLVPEVSLLNIDFKKYFIEIHLDSCEYVYDLKNLSTYSGSSYVKKRGKVNSFLRNNPNAQIKILDLQKLDNITQLFKLNESWIRNHGKSDFGDDKEFAALKRFLEANFKTSYCLGVYNKDILIGYSIFTFHPNGYVISHFTKADINYNGIYEYLMRECALFLQTKGYRFMNFQEDMGLPGLRVAKSSYRPTGFLRKYVIKRY